MGCINQILFSLVVLVQCLQLAYSQIEGYSNIRFETVPQDTYATVSLGIAYFDCVAKGTSNSTNQEELLDVRFIRNSQPMIDLYHPRWRHDYIIDGLVVGLIVVPLKESDDGATYRCQVYHNDALVQGLITEPVTLTVGDGRPPAIPLTLVSSSISQITVSWSSVTVPSNGAILHYNALAYKKSDDSLVSNVTFNKDELQYSFTGLQPNTAYQLSIIGINSYGEGDKTLFEGSTQTPVVTGAPTDLIFNTVPGEGNIIVSVVPPVVDNQTMTPVTYYHLQYNPTSNPSNVKNVTKMSASNPNIAVYNLILGTQYTFRVRAENSAGLGTPIEEQHVIVVYTGSQTIAPSTSALPPTTLPPTQPPLPTTTTSPLTTSTVVVVAQTSSTSTSSTGTIPITTTSTTITTGSVTVVVTLTTPIPSVTTSTTVTEHRSTSSTEESLVLKTATSEHVPSTTTSTGTTRTSTASTDTTSTVSTATNTQTPPLRASSSVTVVDRNKNADASSGSDLPFNAVVLAIGVIALVIMVAIVVAAVLLVCFCIRSRKQDRDFTDFQPSPSPWTHKSTATNPKWDSKDSSIKGSPLSGSLSDDIELPIEGDYLQIPSDSPSNGRPESDIKQHATKIKAEINGSAASAMSSTPV